MKKNEEYDIHLGNNIKHLMRAFQMTQTQLADKLEMPDSHVCNLLQKANIDDTMLQRIADALGYGITVDGIKNYNHEDTISYITNNYTQNVENGGTGTLIPKQDNSSHSTFQEGSTQNNNYVAEQAFEFLKENADLKTEIMRLRMKYEADEVEREVKSRK